MVSIRFFEYLKGKREEKLKENKKFTWPRNNLDLIREKNMKLAKSTYYLFT